MVVSFLDTQKIEQLREGINSDPEFRLAAKFFSKNILLEAGDSQCIIKVRDGAIKEILLNPTPFDEWNFFIKAPAASWGKFFQPSPPPFFHGLFAAAIQEDFQFGGDLEALFAHYWAVQRMLNVMRERQ